MSIKKGTLGILIISFLLSGCANKEEELVYETTTEKGPKRFDNSGTLRCSEDSSRLDDVCDYRSVQKARYSIIWIEDVASPDLIRYRVFKFDHETHNFIARNGEPVEWSERDDHKYLVSVADSKYLISHRSLTEGYKYKSKSL